VCPSCPKDWRRRSTSRRWPTSSNSLPSDREVKRPRRVKNLSSSVRPSHGGYRTLLELFCRSACGVGRVRIPSATTDYVDHGLIRRRGMYSNPMYRSQLRRMCPKQMGNLRTRPRPWTPTRVEEPDSPLKLVQSQRVRDQAICAPVLSTGARSGSQDCLLGIAISRPHIDDSSGVRLA
jgi:hypothetical protein